MSLVLSHHRLSQQSNPASIHSPLSYQVRLEYLVVYRIYSALLNIRVATGSGNRGLCDKINHWRIDDVGLGAHL